MTLAGKRVVPLLLVAAAVGCDFQPDPPEGPSAVSPGRFVDVTITYRQPNACLHPDPAHCNDLVWFFGSWMHASQEVPLSEDPASRLWTGVVTGVPVNWPPVDEPHYVRVYDPHLVGSPTGGVAAARLTVGGQLLAEYDSPGTARESALVYVDGSGIGHNPF